MDPLTTMARDNGRFRPTEEFAVEDVQGLDALAHPVRLRILEHLIDREATTAMVAEALQEDRTRLYHHMERLREAGLIEVARIESFGRVTIRLFRAVARRFTFEFPRDPGPDLPGRGADGGS